MVFTTYRSKKKRKPLRWAALRKGFSQTNWAEHLELSCAEAKLPGPDFFLRRPTADLRGFTDFPADWGDGNRLLRALLVSLGKSAEEASTFTLHSCRHTYPNFGGQLLMPPDAISLMGHWETKSDKMPGEYDSTRIAHELAYKSYIVENVVSGWKPVDEGCVPNAPVVGRPGLKVWNEPMTSTSSASACSHAPSPAEVFGEEYKGEAEHSSMSSQYDLCPRARIKS